MKTSVYHLFRGLFMIFLAGAISACQPKKTSIDSEKDKTAITQWSNECLTAVRDLNKDNVEAYVRFTYTEDAIIFPPAAKSIMGYEAIIGFYQNYPPMSEFNQEVEEIEVSGNFAYLRLKWSLPVKNTGVNPYIDSGVIFCIMQKDGDGKWKIWREIWNSDISAPTAPTPLLIQKNSL